MDGNTTQAKGLPQLGERLKAAREAAGLRQREVEVAMGTSNVSRWEAGSHRMYVNDLLRLALLYQIGSLDELLGPIEALVPEEDWPRIPSGDEAPSSRQELLEWLEELSPEALEKLLAARKRSQVPLGSRGPKRP